MGKGAVLLGTEVVPHLEMIGEFELLEIGFMWLNPEPSEKAKDEIKKRILDMAADENMLVSAMHFYPPPSLGYVNRIGNEWEWHPID